MFVIDAGPLLFLSHMKMGVYHHMSLCHLPFSSLSTDIPSLTHNEVDSGEAISVSHRVLQFHLYILPSFNTMNTGAHNPTLFI